MIARLLDGREESPDCIGQGVPVKARIPRTIRRGKESATENIPPASAGKGEKVG